MRNWILSPANVVPNTIQKRSADRSLEFNGLGHVYQDVYLETGQTYTFSTYMYTASTSTTNPVVVLYNYDSYPLGDPLANYPKIDPANELAVIPFATTKTHNSWNYRPTVQITVPADTDPIKRFIVSIEVRAGNYDQPFYIDDTMLNRGDAVLPYLVHATDYFYGTDLVNELPPTVYDTLNLETTRLFYDSERTLYYIRVNVQIDPSLPVFVTLTDPVGVYPSITETNYADNDPFSLEYWREYGDATKIYLNSAFSGYYGGLTVDAQKSLILYTAFTSTASQVLNGSLLIEGSITADKLNVFKLSSISADIGEITAGIVKSFDYGPNTGSKFDLNNAHLKLGGGDDVNTYQMYFDGTNLNFGGGAIKWDNLDAESQTNLTGPPGPPGPPGDSINSSLDVNATAGFAFLKKPSYYQNPIVSTDFDPYETLVTVLTGITNDISWQLLSGVLKYWDGLSWVSISAGQTFITNVKSANFYAESIGASGITITNTGSGPYGPYYLDSESASLKIYDATNESTIYTIITLRKTDKVAGNYIDGTGAYIGNLTAQHIVTGDIHNNLTTPNAFKNPTNPEYNNYGFFLGSYSGGQNLLIGNKNNYIQISPTAVYSKIPFFYVTNDRIVSTGWALKGTSLSKSLSILNEIDFIYDGQIHTYSAPINAPLRLAGTTYPAGSYYYYENAGIKYLSYSKNGGLTGTIMFFTGVIGSTYTDGDSQWTIISNYNPSALSSFPLRQPSTLYNVNTIVRYDVTDTYGNVYSIPLRATKTGTTSAASTINYELLNTATSLSDGTITWTIVTNSYTDTYSFCAFELASLGASPGTVANYGSYGGSYDYSGLIVDATRTPNVVAIRGLSIGTSTITGHRIITQDTDSVLQTTASSYGSAPSYRGLQTNGGVIVTANLSESTILQTSRVPGSFCASSSGQLFIGGANYNHWKVALAAHVVQVDIGAVLEFPSSGTNGLLGMMPSGAFLNAYKDSPNYQVVLRHTLGITSFHVAITVLGRPAGAPATPLVITKNTTHITLTYGAPDFIDYDILVMLIPYGST